MHMNKSSRTHGKSSSPYEANCEPSEVACRRSKTPQSGSGPVKSRSLHAIQSATHGCAADSQNARILTKPCHYCELRLPCLLSRLQHFGSILTTEVAPVARLRKPP